LESFKADSSRQTKRSRELRREKKRTARVRAQRAAKKAQDKLQDCVDRETLLVEEATHPPGRISGGHTSFSSTRRKSRKEGAQQLHELDSEHDAATKVGKQRRKKHVPQRLGARATATEWSWTALFMMLLTVYGGLLGTLGLGMW
jgi:hypothetical protein